LPDDIPPSTIPPAGPPSDGPPDMGSNGNGYDPLNIADELKDSYLTYAMSVIISRA
jgi:DNA gyrase subunit A